MMSKIHTPNFNEIVGKGAFGCIYRSNEDDDFVVKVIDKQYNGKIKSLYDDEFIKITRGHQNIIHLFEVHFVENQYHIVMEYLDGMDLFDIIDKEGSLAEPILLDGYEFSDNMYGKLKRKFLTMMDIYILSDKSNHGVKSIMRDILRALEYLHKNDIIHGDVKPENIRISNNSNAKLFDFTLSNKNDGKSKTVSGSPGYVAPELFMNRIEKKTYFDTKSDIWSLGVTLFTTMEAKFLFDYSEIRYNLYDIMNTDFGNKINKNKWDNKLKNAFCDMMMINPSSRPSAKSLLNDYFVFF